MCLNGTRTAPKKFGLFIIKNWTWPNYEYAGTTDPWAGWAIPPLKIWSGIVQASATNPKYARQYLTCASQVTWTVTFCGWNVCLGDLLTCRLFLLHLLQRATNEAFISNTEEMTIKIIQNKAIFPFILTLWVWGCSDFISPELLLFLNCSFATCHHQLSNSQKFINFMNIVENQPIRVKLVP